MRQTLRDPRWRGGVALALDRSGLEAALGESRHESVRDALAMLADAGHIVTDSTGRWTRPTVLRDGCRRRVYLFQGVSDPLRLRQIVRGLRHDRGLGLKGRGRSRITAIPFS